MQRPPATSLQVSRSKRLGWLFAGLIFLFLCAPLYSVWSGQAWDRTLAVWAAWGVLSANLVLSWRRMPEGRLRWDGETWYWGSLSQPIKAVRIQYDFQRTLWVLLQPEQGQQFGVWLEADALNPERWHSVRRALVWCEETAWGAEGAIAPAAGMHP
jgi:hypothetical protein